MGWRLPSDHQTISTWVGEPDYLSIGWRFPNPLAAFKVRWGPCLPEHRVEVPEEDGELGETVPERHDQGNLEDDEGEGHHVEEAESGFIIIMMIAVVYVNMSMFKVKVTCTLPRQDSGAHSPPERKTLRDGSRYQNG